jgi:hypothetical protein
MISLVDDTHCLNYGIWGTGRSPSGHHARIYRRNCGKWERRTHEVFVYPGRSEIEWDSPNHPKKDWLGYYFVHLWVYKDNVAKRTWHTNLHITNEKPKEILQKLMDYNGWRIIPIPDNVSWVDIKEVN